LKSYTETFSFPVPVAIVNSEPWSVIEAVSIGQSGILLILDHVSVTRSVAATGPGNTRANGDIAHNTKCIHRSSRGKLNIKMVQKEAEYRSDVASYHSQL
jgi:hypothetical protein